ISCEENLVDLCNRNSVVVFLLIRRNLKGKKVDLPQSSLNIACYNCIYSSYRKHCKSGF
ncbi:hypothetical protein L9F63_008930, partial [Diploptera punctata]